MSFSRHLGGASPRPYKVTFGFIILGSLLGCMQCNHTIRGWRSEVGNWRGTLIVTVRLLFRVVCWVAYNATPTDLYKQSKCGGIFSFIFHSSFFILHFSFGLGRTARGSLYCLHYFIIFSIKS